MVGQQTDRSRRLRAEVADYFLRIADRPRMEPALVRLDELRGHRQHDGQVRSALMDPPVNSIGGPRAPREGGGGFAGGGFLFRDYQIGDGSDLLRGEVGGRHQSHPGSIDRGVETLRHALAPTFRAGAMLLFIPSRVGAPPHLTRRIEINKETANQAPLPSLCLQRAPFQRTSTRQHLDCAGTLA